MIAGHLATGAASPGLYCKATEHAVIEFQQARGLRAHGRCDDTTWAALVEASWSLGDRVLFHTSPNLRGDDVADVQTLLTRLGFDCGRVDGIYGPDTAAAVSEFQRNCGLTVDGSCGRATIVALQRLSRHTGQGPGVATLREAEVLRDHHSELHHHRIVLGHFGGVAPVVRAVARLVRQHGAEVITLDDPDTRLQAAAAHRYEAEVYVGLEAQATEGIEIAFYSVPSFTSPGGRWLAERMAQHVKDDPVLNSWSVHVVGMRLPILRETRMPAVMLTLGPVREVVDHAPALAVALTSSLAAWLGSPQPPPLTG